MLESQLYTYKQAEKCCYEQIRLWKKRLSYKCVYFKDNWTAYSTIVDSIETCICPSVPKEVQDKFDQKFPNKDESELVSFFKVLTGAWDRELKKQKAYYKECLDEVLPKYAQQCQDAINSINSQITNNIQIHEDKTYDLLQQIYSMNLIHPKYRNFVAIAQILEYFDTGRCTELGGPNGAYNLYEQELRQNIIIDKLDQIINQLDSLNRTMGYIASAITQTNRLLEDISSSLGHIEANTALTAYNTQCIAYNTELANRYNYR